MARHELEGMIQRLRNNHGKRVYLTMSSGIEITGIVADVENAKRGAHTKVALRMGTEVKMYSTDIIDRMTTKGLIPKGAEGALWSNVGNYIRVERTDGRTYRGKVVEVHRNELGEYCVALEVSTQLVVRIEVETIKEWSHLMQREAVQDTAAPVNEQTLTSLPARAEKVKHTRMVEVLQRHCLLGTRVTILSTEGTLLTANRSMLEVGKDYVSIHKSNGVITLIPVRAIGTLEYSNK